MKINRLFRKRFIKAFKKCLEECNEILIEPISNKRILEVFETQGYWSGVHYNISFDHDLGFSYEQRRFQK